MVFAYSELGVSIDDFWNLSYYEFGLLILKSKKRFERSAVLVREVMALIANVNRDSRKKSSPYIGSDFIKLSFDNDSKETVSKRMTPEEVEKKFSKILKHGSNSKS